jgi:ABC-type hemin transport system ATPase subunit
MAFAGDPPVQVVDKDGIFNAAGVAAFAQDSGVVAVGGGYQMVAIMGPQSSGKSTLLNHLVSADVAGRKY